MAKLKRVTKDKFIEMCCSKEEWLARTIEVLYLHLNMFPYSDKSSIEWWYHSMRENGGVAFLPYLTICKFIKRNKDKFFTIIGK